ncbi:hypothetical protein J8C06_03965 [Chloracidobacterium validum]|uniref:Uncharacterized protein n=1 Tax=Chloracidobacterium validum TaxID=2821543 RepID=A0ABX8BEV6_9BACT|nr:hypothetical protein [Chloracidobacterium validum]QUW03600.1 hypothetical protein J8C06_03965 [Chloracidobacterium validum]
MARTRTPIDERELPSWAALLPSVRDSFEVAGVTPTDFAWFGRRRGDLLNFYWALRRKRLWRHVTFKQPNLEVGFNGLRLHPRFGTDELLADLRADATFTDLRQTYRGRFNSRLHPERYNFSENDTSLAALHFNFDDDATVDVHFDYFNAHAPGGWPLIAHALWEYPLKFLVDYSNAEDIRRCFQARDGQDPWQVTRGVTDEPPQKALGY